MPFEQQLDAPLSLRLTQQDRNALDDLAKIRGMNPTALARLYIGKGLLSDIHTKLPSAVTGLAGKPVEEDLVAATDAYDVARILYRNKHLFKEEAR